MLLCCIAGHGTVTWRPACARSSVVPRSPQGLATESCDDTPKWRKTLAAREEEEEAEQEEEEAEDITKKLMFSPAKRHLQAQKVESGVTPPGASANEQANIRVTKFHGKHAGVPGWPKDEPAIPVTPTWAKSPRLE